MKIIFLGPPGAGKGTQAVRVSKELNIPHISTGDIFREAINNGTEMGIKAKTFMDKGELVPDEVVIGIVVDRLGEDDASGGFLLDGFPRTVAQAEALDKALSDMGGIDKAVGLDVDDAELINRLAGRRVCRNCGRNYHTIYSPPKIENVCDDCGGEVYQRDDDKEDTVRRRLDVYKQQTQPLIDYYKSKNLLVSIDGKQQIDKITTDILSAVR